MSESPASGAAAGNGTVMVIVTYGRRLALLQQVVAGLADSRHVARIVIVDNGCPEPIMAEALGSPHPVTIVRSDSNLGSAGGFARGIAAALSVDGAGYLAILDDDNRGNDDYLGQLIALHRELGGTDDIAIAALRADRPEYRALLANEAAPDHRPNSFLGFHIGNIPRKLLRKAGLGRKTGAKAVHLRQISRAPYGGLFLTMAMARRAGPPRADFILYGDDHEYTRRLTQLGVRLFLTDRASVADIDQSWNVVQDRGSRWIDTQSAPWRIYYAARNHHYLERSQPGAGAMLTINRWVLTAGLAAEALIRHRSIGGARAALGPYRAAMADARSKKLGYNENFALPGWKNETGSNTGSH